MINCLQANSPSAPQQPPTASEQPTERVTMFVRSDECHQSLASKSEALRAASSGGSSASSSRGRSAKESLGHMVSSEKSGSTARTHDDSLARCQAVGSEAKDAKDDDANDRGPKELEELTPHTSSHASLEPLDAAERAGTELARAGAAGQGSDERGAPSAASTAGARDDEGGDDDEEEGDVGDVGPLAQQEEEESSGRRLSFGTVAKTSVKVKVGRRRRLASLGKQTTDFTAKLLRGRSRGVHINIHGEPNKPHAPGDSSRKKHDPRKKSGVAGTAGTAVIMALHGVKSKTSANEQQAAASGAEGAAAGRIGMTCRPAPTEIPTETDNDDHDHDQYDQSPSLAAAQDVAQAAKAERLSLSKASFVEQPAPGLDAKRMPVQAESPNEDSSAAEPEEPDAKATKSTSASARKILMSADSISSKSFGIDSFGMGSSSNVSKGLRSLAQKVTTVMHVVRDRSEISLRLFQKRTAMSTMLFEHLKVLYHEQYEHRALSVSAFVNLEEAHGVGREWIEVRLLTMIHIQSPDTRDTRR